MRRLLAILLMPALIAAAPAPKPKRIVSLNLCADQYLMALADRGQIVALSRNARDPSMSADAAKARRYPITRGGAEDVLALRPDLIVAAPGRVDAATTALRGRAHTLDVPPANSYAEIIDQVRTIAAAVGHPARGEALIAHMNAQLGTVSTGAGRGRTAAYYQRRGYLTGAGTLVDELLRHVGLRNLAASLGKPALSRIGLEELARAQPDYLVVETETDRISDQGTEMLHHPVLASIPRIRLPQSWTVCGGPAYVRAARSIAAQLR